MQNGGPGQITGGILDGPLALDNAINLTAAQIKHINSPVAGYADILVVPDLEAGQHAGQEPDLFWPTPMPLASCWAPRCRLS